MDVAINYTVENIAVVTQGKLLQHTSNVQPTHLLLDSRRLLFAEQTIFFAVTNTNTKGDHFIKSLYENGVRNFVIDNSYFNYSEYQLANFILVDNTIDALQLLALHHRNKFSIPVIGITGSNGKTIIKEWLYQLLVKDFNIIRSPKSYNSQIGVPLSVLQISNQHTLAIIEAGISKVGEMAKLGKIIQPSIGIFTNIGEAHNEGFKNRAEKINEKLKLFVQSSSLIVCNDDDEIKNNARLKLLTWGNKNDDLYKIISVEKQEKLTSIKINYLGENIQFSIPFIDEASIQNAITCCCVLLQLNISPKIIAERMLHLHPVEMRLELKQGINNCSIINDSYSADISSLQIALNFLHTQKQHQKQTVIISDILQSGKSQNDLYTEVALLLKQQKIERLIAIGPQINLQKELFFFLKEKDFFISVDDFKKHFNTLSFRDEAILIKGARVFEFEQINNLLEQKVHQTILSVNLSAVAYNLRQYRGLLKPGVKTMAVVKAFSYGSGSYEIASLLQFNNIDYLAVAYADEGVELRKAGITLPVMVMNPEENSFNTLVKYNLEPEIFSLGSLLSFQNYLISAGLQYYPVHIKIDTGMHRLGFEIEDIKMLSDYLKNNNTIKVQSIFSHLAASDDPFQIEFTNKQLDIFLHSCKNLQKVLSYNFIRHIANTSAINGSNDFQLDMVRIGIGLYGIDSNIKMQKKLRNVLTLTTTIAQIKHVKAGENVGYGCKAKLKKDSVIAVARIGYADGYPRILSNGAGNMLIKNTLVPVVGNICMDMTMLDVSEITNIKAGDEIIVFGEPLLISELAKWAGTIPYEIMTNISQRVKRIYFEE